MKLYCLDATPTLTFGEEYSCALIQDNVYIDNLEKASQVELINDKGRVEICSVHRFSKNKPEQVSQPMFLYLIHWRDEDNDKHSLVRVMSNQDMVKFCNDKYIDSIQKIV